LRIGIASREEIQARTMAIVRGQFRPGRNDPKVWFTSLESLAQVLSTKNQLLLELIARDKPASMRELAVLSGRQASNLSRTLTTLERYGLIQIKRDSGRRVPEALYDKIELHLDVGGNPATAHPRPATARRLEPAN
jgi:predicted transcriptional regulator